MYNERKEDFRIKDLVLQISFVLLFIFLLLWLFPTRSFIDRTVENLERERFLAKHERFTTAGVDYLKDNLETERITLEYMKDNELLVDFEYDSCDVEESFIEVSEEDEILVFESFLKCEDQEETRTIEVAIEEEETDVDENDEIDNDEDETVETPSEPAPSRPAPSEPAPSRPAPSEPAPSRPAPSEPAPTVYKYEYRKIEDGRWSDWSSWSDWTNDKLEVTASRRREQRITESGQVQYRYITRTFIPGEVSLSYSSSQNDTNLIEKGYEFTGGKVRT